MSLTEPRFGDVFEYERGGGKIMYVCPVPSRDNSLWPKDWIGVTIDPAGTALNTQGEVAQRVPLLDTDSRFAHWTEVPDDAD